MLPKLLSCIDEMKKSASPFLSIDEKSILQILKSLPSSTQSNIENLPKEQKKAIIEMLHLNQGRELLTSISSEKLGHLSLQMKEMGDFYRDIGGLFGYQKLVCGLLQKDVLSKIEKVFFSPPTPIDITKPSAVIDKAIAKGLEAIDQVVEIYPIGGAADRLNLIGQKEQKNLSAATLSFCDIPLIKRLFRDLSAREYLYYQLTGIEVETPVIVMASKAKESYQQIQDLFQRENWFERSRDKIFLIKQPLVPSFDERGRWCYGDDGELLCRPGGHGVLWKLMQEEGLFAKLEVMGIRKGIVRQINNLSAGVDFGLLAFLGFGILQNSLFGFSSCPPIEGVSEGINVVKTHTENGKKLSILSNIEYCVKTSQKLLGRKSQYLANTNLLFVDLPSIERTLKNVPFPGLLVNFKEGLCYDFQDQKFCRQKTARLEATMQSIVDHIDVSEKAIENREIYVTKGLRHKTLTALKKFSSKEEKALLETPEGAIYDLLQNHYELLSKCANWKLPAFPKRDQFIHSTLPFFFTYHPALGPIYSIIAQKMPRGCIEKGSWLNLEVTDVLLEDLTLKGALEVYAPFSKAKNSSVLLRNVEVVNRGVRKENLYPKNVWKGKATFEEKLQITLEEGAQFIAEGVRFVGKHEIYVERGYRLVAYQVGNRIEYRREKRTETKPVWMYSQEQSGKIKLLLNEKGVLPSD